MDFNEANQQASQAQNAQQSQQSTPHFDNATFDQFDSSNTIDVNELLSKVN